MILRIIDEIEKALSHDLYFAALNLALTLPDICGKAEYPDLRTGERYKKWYDEIVGVTEKPPKRTEDESAEKWEASHPNRPLFVGDSVRAAVSHLRRRRQQFNDKL